MHSRKASPRGAHKRRRKADGAPTSETSITQLVGLQQSAGNAAVSRLVQRAPRERPASTDVAGLKKGKRKKAAKPAPKRATMKDIHARVIFVEIVGGMARIGISAGPDQGVEVGMAGYLVRRDGKPYKDFEIVEIRGRASFALVEATADEVSANPKVVITPSSGGSPPVEQQHF